MHKLQNGGIFGKMIEQATADDTFAQEKEAAKERKKQQLAEAEREHDQAVAEEEAEEQAKLKKEQEEAEAVALEKAKSSTSAKLQDAANLAAQSINMGDIEANIQANLQAKLEAGASKTELLAAVGSIGSDDFASPPLSTNLATASSSNLATSSSTNVQDVMAKVLGTHKKASLAQAAPALAPIALAPLPVAELAPVALPQVKIAALAPIKAIPSPVIAAPQS